MAIELSSLGYEIRYLDGKKHLAECFSRNPCEWSHRAYVEEDQEEDVLCGSSEEAITNEEKNVAFVYRTENWEERYHINKDWLNMQMKFVNLIECENNKVENYQSQDKYCMSLIKIPMKRQKKKKCWKNVLLL